MLKNPRVAANGVIIVLLCLFTLTTCAPPGMEPGGDTGVELQPPSNVNAVRLSETNDLWVTWKAADNADSDVRYEVFRIEAGGGAEQVTTSGLNSTVYQDSTYPVGKAIIYKVRSIKGAQVSALSDPSLALTISMPELPVSNVKATILKYSDLVRVSWSPITQSGVTPVYVMGRFLSKGNINADIATDDQLKFHTSLDGSLYYDDTAAAGDTAYYYRVDWVDSATGTSGANGKFAFGLRCSSDDYVYEPNDNRSLLPVETTVVPQDKTLTMFKFMDAGVTDQDTDWYKYHGEPRLVIVTVTLPGGSPLSGNLQFEYYYNGSYMTGNTIVEGNTLQIFDNEAFGESPPPVVDLYFRVRPNDTATNMIGTYTLVMTHSY